MPKHDRYTPEKKAEAVADLVALGWAGTCTKHGIAKSTLKAWVDNAKNGRKPRQIGEKISTPKIDLGTRTELAGLTPEEKQARFDTALDKFLFSTVEMLQSWVEVCGEKEWVRSNPVGARELGTVILAKADTLVSLLIHTEADPPRDDPGR